LKIEVKDRRTNKELLFEPQILGKGIKSINDPLEAQQKDLEP
jgi:hypothetical protein